MPISTSTLKNYMTFVHFLNENLVFFSGNGFNDYTDRIFSYCEEFHQLHPVHPGNPPAEEQVRGESFILMGFILAFRGKVGKLYFTRMTRIE
jgi:hypothetical protein